MTWNRFLEIQINLQHLCLLRWLRQFNLPSIPLEKLVVYSNDNTILKNLTNKSAITKIVIHKERLIERIDKLQARYSKKCFTETDLLHLSFQFLSVHTPEEIDAMQMYGVHADE